MYFYHSWTQENRIVFAVFYCLTFAASFDCEVWFDRLLFDQRKTVLKTL
jgi:hypothetical protein